MRHLIYGLCEPGTSFVRYVGYRCEKKKQSLARRLWEHIDESKKKTGTHKRHWIRKLLSEGKEPIVIVLEEVTAETWEAREKEWIATLRDSNNLTNSTSGGEGLINPTQDIRDRIAAKCRILSLGNKHALGLKHTVETKRKQSETSKALWAEGGVMRNRKKAVISAEGREKLRVNLGKTFSAEHRAKISASLRKVSHKLAKGASGSRWITNGKETSRLKSGDILPEGWRYGNLDTVERNKTLVLSPDARTKISKARTGSKMSEETKARIAETMRRVRADKNWSTKSNAASHVA